MNCLFIANILLSTRTAKFWRKNRISILEQFESAEVFYPESTSDIPAIDLKNIEVIIFIGDDIFFNRIVNNLFLLLMENFGQNILAFLPDSNHSALTEGLGLPRGVQPAIDLIKRKQTIPLDLIRCHYIDHHGFPNNQLILNDVLIGLPLLKIPLILNTLVRWIKSISMMPFRKNRKTVSLLHEGNLLYQGEYFFGILMLGNRVTGGPKIGRKRRINLSKFVYAQINTRSLKGVATALSDLLSGRLEGKSPNLLCQKFNALEINGVGQDNQLIADGIHIGRLPASFTLLPKAVRVISPLITANIQKPWKGKLAPAKVPKPVGNREIVDTPRHSNGD
ncbi:MAG: hypothetical protein HQ517_16690 [SAR324 cluster bacterium]|nr:hypothetical protein [SAR324 cluster bacterium]